MLARAIDIDHKATEYVLALAILCDATRNRNNPICVTQPKVAKASTMVSVDCPLLPRYRDKHSTSPKVTKARIVLVAVADSFTKTAPILMSF
jgi:hypothetical protein